MVDNVHIIQVQANVVVVLVSLRSITLRRLPLRLTTTIWNGCYGAHPVAAGYYI